MATLKIKANKANNESVNAAKQVSNPESESTMMKQYREQKEKHPGALLLFRCGDFYETYFEDAATVNDVLGVTVTKKGDITMAGFPHHALDKYLPKLITAGKRVAICDEIAPSNSPDRGGQETPKEDKAVTVPLGQHGTLVIGKPGFEPKEDKPKVTLKKKTPQPAEEPISEQPVDEQPDPNGEPDPDAVGEIVEVPSATSELPVVKYSTYKTKKGDTAPQIIGFGGPDDPRWQSHKEAGHKYVSASWKKDLNGEKVFLLMFGTRYMDVAKALAGAYNTDDREAWKRAEDACMAIYEQAQRDGKARWEAKKAEWKQKADERKAKKEADRKCYTKEDVAAMLKKVLAGGELPKDIEAEMKKAA